MDKGTCSIDGCEGVTGVPGTARGWCSKHYNRWQRHGDPNEPGLIKGDDVARFWAKVDKNGPIPEHCPELGPCWVRSAAYVNGDGYGAFSYINGDGRCIRLGAHRWLLGHLRGVHLGPGEESCHHCDNPPCGNPSHLRIGTHQENMDDREQTRPWLAVKGHALPAGAPVRRGEHADRQRGQAPMPYMQPCRRSPPPEGHDALQERPRTRGRQPDHHEGRPAEVPIRRRLGRREQRTHAPDLGRSVRRVSPRISSLAPGAPAPGGFPCPRRDHA